MIIFGRKIRNRYLLAGDIFLSVVAVLASYLIRLELIAIFPTYQLSMLWMLGVVVVIKPLIYFLFGIYRRLWRYASIRELVLIISAVTTASMVVAGIMIGLFAAGFFVGFPRSVLVIDWLLSLAFVGGLRFVFRLMAESTSAAAEGDHTLLPEKPLWRGKALRLLDHEELPGVVQHVRRERDSL